jgi:hypothetical protein
MSETGIEEAYAKRVQERVAGGVHLLVWLTVYGCAVVVVFLDLFVWRPW